MARGKKKSQREDAPAPPEVAADVSRLQRQAEGTMRGMAYKAEQGRSKKRSKARRQ